MAGRPKKTEQKKTKNRNGTGTISKSIQKVDRKDKRLTKMCKICSNCKDRTVCDNRIGTKKCNLCLECNSKECDRFYIYETHRAISSSKNGKTRKSLGRFDKQDEAQNEIIKATTVGFVETSNLTLFEVLERRNVLNREANHITSGTADRNLAVRNKIQKYGLGNKKIQKVTSNDIQEYLNTLKDSSSQSEIDK